MDAAIQVEGLRKRYREADALCGVDLDVRSGSVLGLLGPNGAGKTTTVRILSTLLTPDGGTARVAGFDVVARPREVRRRIAVAGQHVAVDDLLTGRENLVLLGILSHLGRAGARARAAELLDQFGLTDAADRPLGTYSGGMRRRLDLACCLVGRPSVLFLDEPTTGLDPASRLALLSTVRDLVTDGVTVLLTTQYLEEADFLADQIVVVAAGRVVATGTPEELKRKVGGERLEVTVALPHTLPAAMAVLAPLAIDPPVTNGERGSMALQLREGMDGIAAAATALRTAGVELADFSLRRPTLDEVFLNLVGEHVS